MRLRRSGDPLIEGEARGAGDRRPGIAVGRMQPFAAEIDATAERGRQRPGAAADTLARFENEERDAGLGQAPSGGDPGRAGAHHDDIDLACHPLLARRASARSHRGTGTALATAASKPLARDDFSRELRAGIG